MSVRARILLLVVLAVAPALLFQAYAQIELARYRHRSEHDEALRLRGLMEAELVRLVEGVRQLLVTLSETDDVRYARSGQCTDLLPRLGSHLPRSYEVHIVDRGGTIVCSNEPTAPGVWIGDRLNVTLAMERGHFVVGEYVVRRSTKRPALTFGMPFRRDGEIAGVVALTMQLQELEEALSRRSLPPDSSVVLADRTGKVLARLPQDLHPVGLSLAQPPWSDLVFAAQGGVNETITPDGQPRTIAYMPVDPDGLGLFLAIALQRDRGLAGLAQGQWTGSLVLVLTLLSSLVIATLAHRRLFARPIQRLETAAARWSRGDYAVRADITAPIELQRLGSVFNAMADAIAKRESDQREAHAAERRLTMALRENRDLLATILDHLPVGVWIIDEQGKIVQGNAAGRRIWGGIRYVETSQFGIYKAWWRDSGRRIAAEEWGAARAIRHGEASLDEEIDIEGFDGSRKTIRHWALPLRRDDGNIRGAIVVNDDITDRVAAADLLRLATRDAEQANAAKSRFLAAVGHDLRQPVQSLVLLMAALRDAVPEGQARTILGYIDSSLASLRGLLDELLDLSRLDAGAVEAKPEDMTLGPLLHQLAGEYALRAAQQGLELTVVASSLRVRSDPMLLERILRNLIENALKYTEAGRVLIGCRRRGTTACIEIYDTGLGIPPEQLEAIFQEFHQLGNRERDLAKGLGLGLAIVQRLAEVLGHSVSVHSAVGKGSCFCVAVPIAGALAPVTANS